MPFCSSFPSLTLIFCFTAFLASVPVLFSQQLLSLIAVWPSAVVFSCLRFTALVCTAPLPDLGSGSLRKFLFRCEKAGELKLGKIRKVKTDGSATVEAATVNSSRAQREKYWRKTLRPFRPASSRELEDSNPAAAATAGQVSPFGGAWPFPSRPTACLAHEDSATLKGVASTLVPNPGAC